MDDRYRKLPAPESLVRAVQDAARSRLHAGVVESPELAKWLVLSTGRPTIGELCRVARLLNCNLWELSTDDTSDKASLPAPVQRALGCFSNLEGRRLARSRRLGSAITELRATLARLLAAVERTDGARSGKLAGMIHDCDEADSDEFAYQSLFATVAVCLSDRIQRDLGAAEQEIRLADLEDGAEALDRVGMVRDRLCAALTPLT